MVNDDVVSRASHYWHEGKKNDYDQAKELWTRVMTDQQRKNTCSNTANGLRRVKFPEIQVSLHISRCEFIKQSRSASNLLKCTTFLRITPAASTIF